MGYCMESKNCNICIPNSKVKHALMAINELHKPEVRNKQASGGRYSGGETLEKWYSWVTNPGPDGFNTIEEAIKEWRYSCHTTEDGDVYIDWFDGQKSGDDNIFFEALAPYIEDGGEIEFVGEDGYHWKYCFDGKEMIELEGKIIWE